MIVAIIVVLLLMHHTHSAKECPNGRFRDSYVPNLHKICPSPLKPKPVKVPPARSMAALFESQSVVVTRGTPPVFQYESLPPTQGLPVVADECGNHGPTSNTLVACRCVPFRKTTFVSQSPVDGNATK